MAAIHVFPLNELQEFPGIQNNTRDYQSSDGHFTVALLLMLSFCHHVLIKLMIFSLEIRTFTNDLFRFAAASPRSASILDVIMTWGRPFRT